MKKHPSMNIHPGKTFDTLLIKENNLSIKEVSEYLNINEEIIQQFVDGKIPIFTELAIKISYVFGGKDDFWMRLQMSYDLFNTNLKFEKDNTLNKLKPFKNHE